MKNLKALEATEQVALLRTLSENPEITAMAAICEILRELPDDAARMRVMRWSFGRFGEEFKRPLADPRPETTPAPLQSSPEPAPPMESPELRPALGQTDVPYRGPDFGREISELKDLFQQPRRVVADSFA
jgi:hypothetical protein